MLLLLLLLIFFTPHASTPNSVPPTLLPQARRVKHCMTDHTECVSYEILRREVTYNLLLLLYSYSCYNPTPTLLLVLCLTLRSGPGDHGP